MEERSRRSAPATQPLAVAEFTRIRDSALGRPRRGCPHPVETRDEAAAAEIQGAQSLADAVTTLVDQFRAGRELDDDLTLVAIQLQPSAAPSKTLATTTATGT